MNQSSRSNIDIEELQSKPSMSRWAWILLVGSLVVCLAGATLGIVTFVRYNGVESTSSVRAEFAVVDGQRAVIPTKADVALFDNTLLTVFQVISLFQTQTEQRNRHMGNSGLTEVRAYGTGTKAYHQPLQGNSALMNIHNHANLIDTMGMGEFAALLNGVEFWTRHNDYRLVMPHPTDARYHRTVPVPHPPVPPAVLNAGSVANQITEMRAWFKAWKDQDTSTRDYRPYFKPVLCYLEGAWVSDNANINEPFASDRHSIDAKNWAELHGKMRFLLNSGRKNNLENLPWLPSSVRDVQTIEDLEVQVEGAAAIKVGKTTDLGRTARSYWYNEDDKLVDRGFLSMHYADTNEGMYVFGSMMPDGGNGNVVLNIQCNSGGCGAAKFKFVSGGPANAVDTGSGTGMSFNVNAARGFMYGPIGPGCWDMEFSIDAGAASGGAKGIRFFTTEDIANPYAAIVKTTPVTAGPGQKMNVKGCREPALPVVGNFEYRILCHPLKDDLPLRRLRLADELSTQLAKGAKTRQQLMETRRARFEIDPSTTAREFYDGEYRYTALDQMMEQIPGKDNYQGNLKDIAFGEEAVHYRHTDRNPRELNSAYYSRFYSLKKTDAMGRSQRKRGFNDNNLWAAMTSQTKVSPLKVVDKGSDNKQPPKVVEQRWTWAIPLEIVYMTPLSTWNPYDVEFSDRGDPNVGKPTRNGRDGGTTVAKAYDGTDYRNFYRTPAAFFNSAEANADAADTSAGTKGVLDKNGNLRLMRASGHWIHFPEIEGLGKLRQRYPVAPLSDEKHLGYQEVTALKDVLFSGNTNYRNGNALADLAADTKGVDLETGESSQFATLHKHSLHLTGDDIAALEQGNTVTKTTNLAAGHQHSIRISRTGTNPSNYEYLITRCDGTDGDVCTLDNHRGLNVIQL